jgi:fatty acyl-ACP thioesterase B
MMNKATRRLSKMPDEVRGEIAPWFIDRHAIEEEATEKIIKLDSNAKYVDSDLKVSSAFFFIHFTRYRNLSCINNKRCYY